MSAERKRMVLALAILFALNIFIIALAQSASADLYKKGSSGATVSEIQTRLKNWGYYTGAVDGVYGSKTEAAVRWFQQKNGLSVDGQAGNKTLAALGIQPSGGGGGGNSASQSGDLYLLARLISAEARGEPYVGQVAVGAVDGVYGSKTEAAVRWFQQKNGLTVDGQAGNKTLAGLGIQPSGGGGAHTARLRRL